MRDTKSPDVVLIAGPTASGKTAHAIERAKELGGEIINADSMQVYQGLRIITARPTPEEEAAVAHHLFGHVDPAQACSVAEWLKQAQATFADIRQRGRVVVFVGGTGLYFQALTQGLTLLPEIPKDIRDYWRGEALRGRLDLHGELQSRDPQAAARLKPNDRQRILRALEVVEATGKPLQQWQEQNPKQKLLEGLVVERHLVMPERSELYDRINRRFLMMVEAGGVREAEAFLQRALAPELPAMKAIGLRELGQYLEGQLSLEAAINAAQTASRHYAKRQMTWFRNQIW